MATRTQYHRAPWMDAPRATPRARQIDKNFYASAPWRKLRAAFLAQGPLCVDCRKQGRITEAKHVHHVLPRKTHPHLALDWDNLEALCVKCHNARKVR